MSNRNPTRSLPPIAIANWTPNKSRQGKIREVKWMRRETRPSSSINHIQLPCCCKPEMLSSSSSSARRQNLLELHEANHAVTLNPSRAPSSSAAPHALQRSSLPRLLQLWAWDMLASQLLDFLISPACLGRALIVYSFPSSTKNQPTISHIFSTASLPFPGFS